MLDTFSGNIKPHSIEEEIKDSFLSYAMSVIVSRALPDVRDGLKPVHRRVLYAMHDLGLQPNRPYRKSATVVGECFVEGTLVHTDRGLRPIERLAPGDQVLMPGGYARAVTQAFHNPPSRVVEVRLSNGSTMTVTPGQLYRVLRDDLSIGWEEARNLEGKTVLASSSRSLGEPARHPSEQTAAEAYVAGLLVTEGYLTDKGRSHRVGVSMADREPLQFVEALCHKKNVPAFWSDKRPRRTGHSTVHTLRFSGLAMAYETCEDRCADKHVPEWVLDDRRLFAPFVAGFMDGDGHFCHRRGKREVVITSASELLIGQLQAMLADCGIHGCRTREDFSGRVYAEGYLPRYNLWFTGESASRFSRLVRDYLKVERKRACARRIAAWERRHPNTNTECIPGEAIFEELSRHHLGSGWYEDSQGNKFRAGIKYPEGAEISYTSNLREKRLSYRQIEDWGIMRKLERIGSPLAERLKTLLETYNVLTVETIEDRGELAETYDVQIADPSHEFLVEGCAVHNCIGKYHPHGDAAVYDTLVRLAQDFSLRYPLVDGQGNFGSVDGDPAAAMRYTETRLTRMATEMLRDISSDTVDFAPNFDESQREPVVLPARFPNLLVNGSDGIAVGMATKIPPHNLGEVVDATLALIDDPQMEDVDLLKYIQGPDFPTGGMIVGAKGIRDAILTGRGSVRVQAKAHTEQIKGNRTQIVVSEIPYQVNKSYLLQKIAELVKERKITDISDLRDESDRNGMRIVIELKREAVPKVVLNNLYKHTQMQQSFGVNLVALVDGVPRTLSYKQALKHYIAHQFEVVTRRTRYDLERARARAHILQGLLIALSNLDEVVATIRRSRTGETARKNLMKHFKLSERQAQAILDLRLQRLTALERKKLEQEHKDLVEKIEYLESVLADEAKVYGIIKGELSEAKAAYGDERRTQITTHEGADFEVEDLIAEEEMVISISHGGYLKSVPVNTFRKQGRGGVGVTGMELKEGDYIEHLFITTTHHYMLFFTNKGKVYRLKVHQLPRMGRTAKGRHIANLLPLAQGERIATVIATKDFTEAEYLIFATRNGAVKKTSFFDYNTPLKSDGIIAIKLADDDELIGVRQASEGEEVVLVTQKGMGIRFPQSDIRPTGRATGGVKGITLKDGDMVLSMDVVDGAADLFLITEKGFGKRTSLSQFRPQSRGGKGLIVMKTNGDRGRLAGVKVVRPELHELVIVSNFGTTIRIDAESVSRQGRGAQGVRVMNLKAGDSVSAIAKVISSRRASRASGGEELLLEEIVNEADPANGEVGRG